MTKLSADQAKALRWFVEANQLRPEMSTAAAYRFTNKKGEIEEHTIRMIEYRYKEANKKGKQS
jgi:hypothetical protein